MLLMIDFEAQNYQIDIDKLERLVACISTMITSDLPWHVLTYQKESWRQEAVSQILVFAVIRDKHQGILNCINNI